MFKKICQIWILIFMANSFSGCHNYEPTHKNNDTRIKSVATDAPVLQMSASRSIAENIMMDTSYSVLSESLEASGLSEMLTKPGPFTFFAPNNAAFKSLPEGTLDGLMKERKSDLANILSHHVVAGLLHDADLREGQKLKTLAGDELIVTKRNEDIIINGVKVNARSARASNGVIYLVDNLFFPRGQNPGAY